MSHSFIACIHAMVKVDNDYKSEGTGWLHWKSLGLLIQGREFEPDVEYRNFLNKTKQNKNVFIINMF